MLREHDVTYRFFQISNRTYASEMLTVPIFDNSMIQETNNHFQLCVSVKTKEAFLFCRGCFRFSFCNIFVTNLVNYSGVLLNLCFITRLGSCANNPLAQLSSIIAQKFTVIW